MQSLSFIPGRAFLSSNSTAVPWTVVFEDEGIAGYFYACDRSQEKHEHSILDAMLIYNVGALARSDAELQRPEPQRIASVEWSRDGLQAVLVHLGGGCSACAVRNGRSMDTTMGLTPLEGLVMSRRSGSCFSIGARPA